MKNIIIFGLFSLLSINNLWAADKQNAWADSYALESKGEYEKAAALLSPYLDAEENSEFAMLRYAWLNYLQGNYNDAIRSYKRALKRNARSFDARLGIALPLMAQKRWKEAARYLQQVVSKSPYNYVAHLRLMACEEGLRQWASLEKHSLALAAYYPSDASILIYLAHAYAWQDNKVAAGKVYHQIVARFPKNIEANHFLTSLQ